MFGTTKPETARRGALSVIGNDVTVTGNIDTAADLHIDGTIVGDVTCGMLVLGATGAVTGTIRAQTARLAGKVEGETIVTSLTIERTARITGDASYETLTIETGAQVDGRMTHGGAAATPEPPLRLTAASE